MNKIKHRLKKIKKGLAKVVLITATAVTTAAISVSSAVAAKVDLKGGVEKVTKEVSKQVKPIFTSIFGIAAVILLGIALFKTIHEFSESRNNERDLNFTPLIKWWTGVILCGLASSASFFGWFGM